MYVVEWNQRLLAITTQENKSHNYSNIYNNRLLLRMLIVNFDSIFAVLSNRQQMNAHSSSHRTVLPPVGQDWVEGNIKPNTHYFCYGKEVRYPDGKPSLGNNCMVAQSHALTTSHPVQCTLSALGAVTTVTDL